MRSREGPEYTGLQGNPQPIQNMFGSDVTGQKLSWKHFSREISCVCNTVTIYRDRKAVTLPGPSMH